MSTDVPDGTVALRARGRAWVFGDAVNTDDMFPGFAMRLPTEEAARYMFNATRPDWPTLVRPGDIVVAGRNFGLGSSRPVPLLFKSLGVAAVAAEQFNSLFYRNCINYGLLAVSIPDVRSLVTEGDTVTVDPVAGRLVNESTGAVSEGAALPSFLLDIVQAGGIFPRLEAAGKLRPHEGPAEE
ncbi:MAG TPA: 3-isopropylmalate dehydratase [Trebonia sp.]|jgi:3-isopropylmalate/(R)-2-methylmalate dehydratase small subunit